MKLVRPGFGPPAEPAAADPSYAASCRLQALIACARVLAATGMPLGFGTRAPAAQLIVRFVKPTAADREARYNFGYDCRAYTGPMASRGTIWRACSWL